MMTPVALMTGRSVDWNSRARRGSSAGLDERRGLVGGRGHGRGRAGEAGRRGASAPPQRVGLLAQRRDDRRVAVPLRSARRRPAAGAAFQSTG